MHGTIPKEMWNEIEEAFLVLPEHGWAKNFIKYVQSRGWSHEYALKFVQWVKKPERNVDVLSYMKEQAHIFDTMTLGEE